MKILNNISAYRLQDDLPIHNVHMELITIL